MGSGDSGDSRQGEPGPGGLVVQEAAGRTWRRVALHALTLLGFGVIYYALTEVGRASMAEGIYNVFRPAAGFLLASLMVGKVRLWPGLVVVATLIDWASARSYPRLEHLTTVLPLMNSLAATVNALLMRRVARDARRLSDVRQLTFFLSITALASVVFATLAAIISEVLAAEGMVPGSNGWQRWLVWATSNLLGVVILGPVALAWLGGTRFPAGRRGRPDPSLGGSAELTLLLAGTIGLTLVIFRDDILSELTFIHITYILVPFMIWIVLRFDLRVALTTWAGVALLASWSTQQGQGPFAKLPGSSYERVLALQIFLSVATLSLLALGAVLSERWRKEEELIESETRYRAVVEDQTELIVRTLTDGTVTFVNGAVERTLERDGEALLGEPWPQFLKGRPAPQTAVISPSQPTSSREDRVELPSGASRWFQWTDRALFNRAGALVGYQSVGRDITALKEARDDLTLANARLQTLSTQLLAAQEDERRALARELHDEVGQTLTALKIDLQRLRNRLSEPAALARLDDATAAADRALQEVRNLSHELRPSVLDDFGLVAALKWYLDRQAERAGFALEFRADPPDLHVHPIVETTCYRIVQEAVNNARKHAGASRLEVDLRRDGGGLSLEVRDDGRGFDVADALARASRGESLGLLGMDERAMLAGGMLTFDSRPGEGTRVVVRFPQPDDCGPATTQLDRSETAPT